tara:strand:- start:2334 stop:3305 length:972 start_codon:yes stop_codon:yes gene_type:complete
MKHLIIGGEGYIGQQLVYDIVKKDKQFVYSYDCLVYKQKKNSVLNKNKYYKFIRAKTSKINNYIKLLKSVDSIVILSGLVGDPITKKYPKFSVDFNEKDIMKIMKLGSRLKVPKIIFVSTCSNYGIVNKKFFASENTPLKPLSLYAKSKVKCEKYLLSLKSDCPTILRFATAFGWSSRMRFDLTVNEFTRNQIYQKEIDIYDENTWRPYCHVKDFSRVIRKILNSDKKKTSYEIFNVGSNKNNSTKKTLINKINMILKIDGKNINYLSKGFDRRNYKVNFKKIEKKLNIKAKFNIEYGIKEIISKIKANKKKYKTVKLGNYKI